LLKTALPSKAVNSTKPSPIRRLMLEVESVGNDREYILRLGLHRNWIIYSSPVVGLSKTRDQSQIVTRVADPGIAEHEIYLSRRALFQDPEKCFWLNNTL
jgi:hypothetical protein